MIFLKLYDNVLQHVLSLAISLKFPQEAISATTIAAKVHNIFENYSSHKYQKSNYTLQCTQMNNILKKFSESMPRSEPHNNTFCAINVMHRTTTRQGCITKTSPLSQKLYLHV